MDQKNGTAACSDGDNSTTNKPCKDGINYYSKTTSLGPQLNTRNIFEGRRTNFTDELWTLVSMITFLADMATDLSVCVKYFTGNNILWFALSVGFLSVSSLLMQIISLKWLWDDGKKESCFTYLLHLLQLGPVWR